MELDLIDTNLVWLLRDDGRLSFESLAQAVGLSRTAVRARLERLMGGGSLRVVGIVHPSILGLTALGHVAIDHHGEALALAQEIAEFDEAPFVSVIAGRDGVIAELQCTDIDAFEAAVVRIRGIAAVRRVETSLYARVHKNAYAPVGQPRALELDDADLQIIGELQRDGRLPFAEMGKRVALSPSAARTRVLRLTDAGLIRISGILNPTVLGMNEMCGFDLSLAGGGEQALAVIAAMPNISYLAAAIGRADAVGTLIAGHTSEIRASLDQIRALPGVLALRSWIHLDLVKERYEWPVAVPARS
jgi:DNA-binding Lrp family transcriptional regulator